MTYAVRDTRYQRTHAPCNVTCRKGSLILKKKKEYLKQEPRDHARNLVPRPWTPEVLRIQRAQKIMDI